MATVLQLVPGPDVAPHVCLLAPQEPGVPGTGVQPGRGAAQLAFVPVAPPQVPAIPLQVQFQGPDPETALAVPLVQRPEAGLVVVGVPFEEPQEPFMPGVAGIVIEQEAVAPIAPQVLVSPTQVHVLLHPFVKVAVLVPLRQVPTVAVPQTPASPAHSGNAVDPAIQPVQTTS